MIGIEGQYLFDAKTENNTSIVNINNLRHFTTIESCDLLLPVFKFQFALNNSINLSYFNEGSILKIALGKDKKDLKYINLQIIQVNESPSQTQDISLIATLYKPTYSSSLKCKTFKNLTSVEIIKSILSNYFTVQSNISISADRQDWVQTGITEKSFVEYLWLNSYVDGGILALGCSAIDNIYVVKNLITVFTSNSYDYRISYTKQNDSDILISKLNGSYGAYGFYNAWKALPQYNLNYNILTDQFEETKFEINTLLSTTSALPLNTTVEPSISKITTYANSKYAQAKPYNLFALSSYSKYSIELETVGQYSPIKLLDKVYLDLNTNAKGNEEYYSGNYIVCRVVRNVSSDNILTKITLCRESPGRVLGNQT